jgi:branched-chain amino acid transport system permease protein
MARHSPAAGVASRETPGSSNRALHLLSLIAIGGLALAPFLGNPYHVTIAINMCVTLILTLSLNLVVGHSGQFHLSHVAFFGVGAYASAILAKEFGLSPWLCLLCAVAIVTALAAAIGVPVTRLRGLYLAVATLAFSLFVEVLVKQGGSLTGGGYGLQDIPTLDLFGMPLRGKTFYALALLVLAGSVMLLGNLQRSKLGREIVASRDHPDAAAAAGINPAMIRVIVLMIAAALAATAGWLHTFYHLSLNASLLSPELTFVWFFMVLVGGIGNTRGVVLGTLLLALMPEVLGFATGQTILTVGILMILVTLFAPRGLGGLVDNLLARHLTGGSDHA